jgi:serine protease Do
VAINSRGETLSVRIEPPGRDKRFHLDRNPPIVARDYRGRRYSAHWLAADSTTGLTLLRLPPQAVKLIRAANVDPNLGSQVFVLGNPFGMGHSVGRGHVAGLDRAVELNEHNLDGLIQIQAAVYPGDSGAAVVNLAGDWFGLIRSGLSVPRPESLDKRSGSSAALPPTLSSDQHTTATIDLLVGRSEQHNNFAFAIPAVDALWIAKQLSTRGSVDRADLGVQLEPDDAGISTTSRSSMGDSPQVIWGDRQVLPVSKAAGADTSQSVVNEGSIVQEVLPRTPAAKQDSSAVIESWCSMVGRSLRHLI